MIQREVAIMSDSITVGLTERQRELLLQGLRYVRSSVKLDVYKPTPETTSTRNDNLREIESLVCQLNEAQPTGVAAEV